MHGMKSVKIYQSFSLGAAVVFAIVGLIFLFIPERVLILFNTISSSMSWPQSPTDGFSFYLILAAAYMYIVTLLAYLMYRQPRSGCYPFLLAHAKLASATISLYLFFRHQPYLIYLANFCIDGLIGLVALYFRRNIKKQAYL